MKVLVIFTMLTLLGACGSDSGNENDQIDLARYFFPESSRIQTYEGFDCDSDSCISNGNETEAINVNGSTITIDTGDDDISTYSIQSGKIEFVSEVDDEIEFQSNFPRYVSNGSDFSAQVNIEFDAYPDEDENEISEYAFGPYNDYTLSFDSESRTDDSVVITIFSRLLTDPDGEPEDRLIFMKFLTPSSGEIGWLEFYCPIDIVISPKTNYKSECGEFYYGSILVSEEIL